MNKQSAKHEGGFSLIELIIAMTITLVVLGIATTLLAQTFRVRTRANDNVDALADAQRALNIMSREIAQAGFNLSDNGIVAADSVTDANNNSTIRIRANLNKFDTSFSTTARNGIGVQGEDAGEDVMYYIFPAPQNNTTLLARYDALASGGGSSSVLANRLDSLRIHYFAQKVTYSTLNCDITAPSALEVASPAQARYIVIAVCVWQEEVGVPGSPGYHPRGPVLLTSDVTLRNSNLNNY
ncbi:MAG TPA: prepilin-type N-terminal cleavage/methylation domain-containing protein [Pyrinomonadaceae bacterium]|nr:prepilin-type N-terminal cleavage/methylation domain-containing protein [Pyrinomonadaceae bacterium]